MKRIAKMFGVALVFGIMAGATVQTKTSPATGEVLMSVDIQEAQAACLPLWSMCYSSTQCCSGSCVKGRCR